jgi:hypothetical protein
MMEAIVPPKRQFTQDLHGATSQKMAFFIVTAMETSNLTQFETWLKTEIYITAFTVIKQS